MDPEKKALTISSSTSCPATCGIRLLWLVFILLSISGWVRMADTIARWDWLKFAGVLPGPLYLAITGGLWGIAGILAAVWLLRGRLWSRLVGFSVVLFYVLTYWIDRLFFAQSPGVSTNTVFSLLVTAAALLISFLVLRPDADLRELFRRAPAGLPQRQPPGL